MPIGLICSISGGGRLNRGVESFECLQHHSTDWSDAFGAVLRLDPLVQRVLSHPCMGST